MPDQTEGKKIRNIYWLMSAPDKLNLADELDDVELGRIGADVVRSYDSDRQDREEWDKLSESAMKLAKQVKEDKSFPWAGASNVKHPLITVASIQFAARAYPEIIKSGQVVKCRITGDEPKLPPQSQSQPQLPGQSVEMGPQSGVPQGPGPGMSEMMPAPPTENSAGPQSGLGGPVGQAGPGTGQFPEQALFPSGSGIPSPPQIIQSKTPKQDRAHRIQNHMNYQLTQEMPEWEPDMDRLLHILPVLGQCFKKTYFSTGEARNIAELVLPEDCVVNFKARSLDKARRVTHRLYFYENDIWEKVRRGLWRDAAIGKPHDVNNDTDAAHEFLEQHRYEDLDGDGYKEPYIVTVHKDTSQVMRIVARWQPDNVEGIQYKGSLKVVSIKPDQYFIHYGFIPNPDGSLNYLGFGQLLEPLNAAINSTLNQLIDAGTLHNTGGGFIGRGVRMRGGNFAFSPGEWKMVDAPGGALKENLVPMPTKEPSAVLFQLLGFLVNAGQEISSVQNVMSGESNMAATMPVGTVMALVEQGLKVFTAIYKRVYRALTEEFRRLYELNSLHLDPEVTFYLAGAPEAYQIGQSDYQLRDMLVVPVADPNLSSDMQRLLKAQALKDLSGRPGVNEVELTRRLVRSIQPDDVSQILLTDEQIQQPPSPQTVLAEAKAQRLTQQAQESALRLQMDMQRFQLDTEGLLADIGKKKAETVLALARAQKESADIESGQNKIALEIYKTEMDLMSSKVKHQADIMREKIRAFVASQKLPGSVGQGPEDQVDEVDLEEMPFTGAGPEQVMIPGGGNGGPGRQTGPGRKLLTDEQKAENEMMRSNTRRPEPGLDLGGMDSLVGRAEGGPVQAGQPYVVGEEGPEVVLPGDRVGQILSQNANKNFVQRIMTPDTNPVLMNYAGPDTHGTHLMMSGEYDGKGVAYPGIVQMPDGSLKKLSGDEAWNHALQNNEYIEFPTPEEAEWFGKNYKSVWGEPTR